MNDSFENRDEGFKEKIKSVVMSRLDLSREIMDEDVSRLIDNCIVTSTEGCYIPLKEKIFLKNEIFNSIRRLDVLSELLEDDEITEIMIDGPRKIFYEKNGKINRSEKTFDKLERPKDGIPADGWGSKQNGK